MNHRPLNSLPLGKAITGFVNYKTAEGLSDRSVDSYKRLLEHWAEYAGNKHVAQFTDHDINAYLVYMRSDASLLFCQQKLIKFTHGINYEAETRSS